MDPDETAALADRLIEARRGVSTIDVFVPPGTEFSLRDGFAVMDTLHERAPEPTAGWLVGLTNPEMQRRFSTDAPYYAPVLARHLHRSPVRLGLASLPPIGLECEVAVRIGSDLPARPTPYTVDEVTAAVSGLAPAIEVVAGHLTRWWERPLPEVVADNGTDGPLVIGAETVDWQGLDLAGLAVELTYDGSAVAAGSTGDAMGGPIAVVTWLANRLNRHGRMLRAGEWVNTGTCTPLHLPTGPGRAAVRFEGLGEVVIDFA